MPPTKSDLRREIRARLREGTADAVDKSEAICRRISAEPAWAAARMVGIFAPHGGEPFVEALWGLAAGRTLCYPRIAGPALEFCPVNSPSELRASVHGLREPGPAVECVGPGLLDLVLVPGMAFTRAGVRLGRGGGFYDRFLARGELRAVRIGVCFEWQIRVEIPEESHDLRVDRVVTEAGVIRVE